MGDLLKQPATLEKKWNMGSEVIEPTSRDHDFREEGRREYMPHKEE